MCYSFDTALELCYEADIRSEVLVLLITLFTVVECHSSRQCVFLLYVIFVLYFISTVFYLSCQSTAYGK